MNLELFADASQASPSEYREALERWLAGEIQAGRMQREASANMYEHMWSSFAAWAVAQDLHLQQLSQDDLERYLNSRGGHDELTARYAWRLLRLIGRVLGQHARFKNLSPNHAADDLLARRLDLKFANASERDPLPEFLRASEAKLLVMHLSAVRPGRASTGQPWQEVRNRASVGVMLGAGLTPGEVRLLKLDDVGIDGGKRLGTPWKLKVSGTGTSPARETPVAPWAGQLLKYWLKIRLEQRIPGSILFPSTKGTGKAWGKVSQYVATTKVLQAAGVDGAEGGSFRLRHTFALRQLRRGSEPAEVARWLGVTEPSTMARYSRVLTAPADVV